MSELGDLQRLFPHLLVKLWGKMWEDGYEFSCGDAFRDPALFGAVGEANGYGHPKSAHKQKLAFDVNLKKNGEYLTKTEDHKVFGEYWKSLHPLARWGGDFKKPDGNHYSLEYLGIK